MDMFQRGKRGFLAILLVVSLLFTGQAASASDREDGDGYSLNTYNCRLLIGDSAKLEVDRVTDEEVTYKSSREEVAQLSDEKKDGCQISGKGVGVSYITVKIRKTNMLIFKTTVATLKCKVNVAPQAVSVHFEKNQYRLRAGKTKKLKLTLKPSITTEKATFTSSDENVAVVSKNGKVTAKEEGIAWVTASIRNGEKAVCKIVVKPPKENSKNSRGL